jgi:hypothetical protein
MRQKDRRLGMILEMMQLIESTKNRMECRS